MKQESNIVDKIHLDVGARVSRGQAVGSLGETGSLKGPFLYFEIRQGGTNLDPLTWLKVN